MLRYTLPSLTRQGTPPDHEILRRFFYFGPKLSWLSGRLLTERVWVRIPPVQLAVKSGLKLYRETGNRHFPLPPAGVVQRPVYLVANAEMRVHLVREKRARSLFRHLLRTMTNG